jgi:hypothetical protein
MSAHIAPLPIGAPSVARGTSRLFLRNQIMVQSEVSLRNGRRADLMGLTTKGEIIIVEIKCSRADLLGDQKWPEYLEYCDRFFWAVPAGFDIGPLHGDAFMPERAGLIIADAYDAEIARPAALVPLAPRGAKPKHKGWHGSPCAASWALPILTPSLRKSKPSKESLA